MLEYDKLPNMENKRDMFDTCLVLTANHVEALHFSHFFLHFAHITNV